MPPPIDPLGQRAWRGGPSDRCRPQPLGLHAGRKNRPRRFPPRRLAGRDSALACDWDCDSFRDSPVTRPVDRRGPAAAKVLLARRFFSPHSARAGGAAPFGGCRRVGLAKTRPPQRAVEVLGQGDPRENLPSLPICHCRRARLPRGPLLTGRWPMLEPAGFLCRQWARPAGRGRLPDDGILAAGSPARVPPESSRVWASFPRLSGHAWRSIQRARRRLGPGATTSGHGQRYHVCHPGRRNGNCQPHRAAAVCGDFSRRLPGQPF